MTKDIVQTISFDAPVGTTYLAIADSNTHSAFTGAPADLPRDAGGRFSTHGGAIEGWILELEPDSRIVQAWRPADWPLGMYSLVRLDFEGNAEHTEITLTHTGLPPEGTEHIAAGWNERYWEPLREFLANSD